jgi:hypothetical protein
MKTLNEQLNRMKSLMGDGRLYGNLVDKKPINEWRLIGQAAKNSDEAFEIFSKAEKYYDDAVKSGKVSRTPEFLNNISKGTSENYNTILNNFSRNLDTVDDMVKHMDEFDAIYKGILSPTQYDSYKSFIKFASENGIENINIVKGLEDGSPYFMKFPAELNLRWVIFSQWFKKQPNAVKKEVVELLRGKKIKNIEPIESTLHYPTKTIDDLASEVGYTWRYFGKNLTAPKMSGWKFHIFGNTLDDSLYLKNELEPLLQKWGAYGKVGGVRHVERFIPGHLQHGKQGATIYIPQSIIDSGQQKQFYNELVSTLSNYKNKGGTINGDKMLTPQIHYRYELTDVIPPGGLRDHNHYRSLYNNASINPNSVYKPNHVVDLFSVKPKSGEILSTSMENNFKITSIIDDTSQINWGSVTNANNLDDYNKFINNAMETGDFSRISRRGFENYGINNFRKYLNTLYNIKNGKSLPINHLKNQLFSGDNIKWADVTNANNLDDYDKVINRAIETGNYSTISRAGFENYGIDNFREYIKNLYGGN